MILFAVFAQSAIYSLDLGSQNLRLSYNQPGKPIDIKLNERDKRFTPNFLAFPLNTNKTELSKAQWIIGADAERIYYRNNQYGVMNPFSLLWTPHNNEFAGLHPIVLSSISFAHILNSLNPKSDKPVIVIPSYTTPQVRFLLMQSIKLLGYRSATLLDSCTAIASLYAVERIKKGSRKPTTILFIDIGAENLDCSLWKFKPMNKKIQMELLQYRHSNSIGGRFVDHGLIKYVEGQLNYTFKKGELFQVTNILRQTKERLSSNPSITADLTEDYGKYVEITQEVVTKICENMTKTLSELLGDIQKPDEIELIGGASRMKVFTDVIVKAFPKLNIRRSLNSDEAASLGATYYTALKSGNIAGSQIEVKKPSMYGLNATFNNKSQVVYYPGDTIKEKSIKMPYNESLIVSQTIDLEIYDEYVIDASVFNLTSSNYTDVLLEGVERAIDGLQEDLTNGTIPNIQLTYGQSQELDCPDLLSATLNANITTTNPRLISKKHGNTTITERKLMLITSMMDESFRIPNDAKRFVNTIIKTEKDRKSRQESCHKIEAFIIDTRERTEFDNDFKLVTTEEERKEMITRLEKERSEVDCAMLVNETKENLDKRFEDLQKLFEKPIERWNEYIHRPAALKSLQSAIKRAESTIPEAKCDNETMDKFMSYLNETKYMVGNLTDVPLLEQPKHLVKDLKEHEKELLKKIPEIKRKPKKNDVINFSSSDTEDMDDEEYERLRRAGIMFNRPKKKNVDPEYRKPYDEDRTKYKEEKKAFDEIRDKFNEEKRAFEQNHTDFWSFRADFRSNTPNFYEDEQKAETERREIVDAMKKEDEERIARINFEWACNYTRKKYNLTADEPLNLTYYNITDPSIPKVNETEINATDDENSLFKITNETLIEELNESLLTPEEKERKEKEEEEKKKREEERKKFLELHSDTDDDLIRPLNDAELERFDSIRSKFEGGSHKPFENDEDRKKYEKERREYERLKRRGGFTPTPKPVKTPEPTPDPMEDPLKEDRERLAADKRRLIEDKMRLEYDKKIFEMQKEYYPKWVSEKAEREEARKREEQERIEMRKREEEERKKRYEEMERKRKEEEQKRREKIEQERKRRQEERKRIEQERRKREEERRQKEKERREREEERRLKDDEKRKQIHEEREQSSEEKRYDYDIDLMDDYGFTDDLIEQEPIVFSDEPTYEYDPEFDDLFTPTPEPTPIPVNYDDGEVIPVREIEYDEVEETEL